MKFINIFKKNKEVKEESAMEVCLRNAHDEKDNAIIENAIWESIVKEIDNKKRAGKHSCYISSSTWNYIPKHFIQQLLDEDYDIQYKIYTNDDCTVFIEVLWNYNTNGSVYSEKCDSLTNKHLTETNIDKMYEDIERSLSLFTQEIL